MGGTVPSDIFTSSTPALSFTMDGETWTVGFSIFVSSSGNVGVSSNTIGSALINNGNIYGFLAGVDFKGAGGAITNNAGHNIVGTFGIILDADGETVTNNGAVTGLTVDGVHFGVNSDHVVLNNNGEIYGRAEGVAARSTLEGGTIVNSGLIRSDFDGILVATAVGETTTVDNAAGGTIAGLSLAIHTTIGAISLNNRGVVDGAILCQAANANDTIINSGKINGEVLLGPGNDTFNGSGGTSGAVNGGAGNDTLIGGKSGDTLDGGAGLDTVRGGRGRDSLFGGTERDLFDFNAIQDSLKGAKRDVIQDFLRGNNVTGDDIDLRDIDAKSGVGGNQAFKFIGTKNFHDQKGELRYIDKGAQVIVQGDTNGDGNADFEILVKVGALSAGDFLL